MRTTTPLSENLRALAGVHPEFANEIADRAQAIDDAYEGYFELEPPVISAQEFLDEWAKARVLYANLSGKD